MNTIHIHAGNPKAYSTFLQSGFSRLESESHIMYLGFRPSQDYHKWYKSSVESNLFNQSLRVESSYHFRESLKENRAFIQAQADAADSLSVPLVLSCESVMMRGFMEELDAAEKLARTFELIAGPVRLHILFRNLRTSIFSLYKEYVKHGYGYSFGYFLDEAYFHRRANFLDALVPGIALETLLPVLRDDTTVNVYFIDGSQPIAAQVNQCLQEILPGQRTGDIDDGVQNRGASMARSEAIAFANSRSDLSLSLSGLMEQHRIFWPELGKSETTDCYFFRNRRAAINSEAGVFARADNADSTEKVFEASRLLDYLVELKKSLQMSDSRIRYFGKESTIWEGIEAQ